tara:strand:+ start:1988 stop:2644 length:657 start_codon:yes stop_codon:yes gene_type:complete
MSTKKKDAGWVSAEVFQTLSSLDISPLITRKMNLDYLSWSRAWLITQKHYPGTTRRFTDFPSPVDSNVKLGALIYPGGSAEVECTVDLLHPSGEILSHTERLSVMDNKNKAILQPDTRDVLDARQRCLVKCLAMGFGLGLSLWSGDIVSMILSEPTEEDRQEREKEIASLVSSCSMSKKDVLNLFEKHKGRPLSGASAEEFAAFGSYVIENHPKGEKK